jgi:hypothetical protein
VKDDFFANYCRSPSILGPHIESEGNKGNEGNMPEMFNEIKANSVSLLPVAVSLDAEQGSMGETEISSQTQGVSDAVSLVCPVAPSRHVEPQNRGREHAVLYLKAGVGDEGEGAGVYNLLCDLRRQGISVRVIEDGRLAVSPSNRISKSQWQQLKRSQRAVRSLLPYMLTPDEVKASAEKHPPTAATKAAKGRARQSDDDGASRTA